MVASWSNYHQQVPVVGQLVVKGAQTCLVVGKGPVKDLPPIPAQGRGPVLSLTDVDTDEDLDVLDIHLCAASRSSGSGPAGGRPVPHPRYERPHTRWAVPLISGH